MTHFPSFILDKYRPGVETDTDGAIWGTNSLKLERVMRGLLAKAGATDLKLSMGGAENDLTSGEASIIYARRNEPPMTAEEAIEIGNRIVTAWEGVKIADSIPEFCDDVFPLPK